MKNLLKLTVITGFASLMFACSDSKGDNSSGAPVADQQNEVVEAPAPPTLDIERMKEMKDKGQKDLTSEDYDFLMDQLEIIMKPTADMTKEEREAYMKNLDEDSQGAMLIIGFAISSANKKGLLSEQQLQRFQEMEQRYN